MKRNSGFTLIELMVTLAVAAIVLSVGVPSFRGLIMDNRMATQANQFVTAVSMARSAAVQYQRNGVACPSTDFDQPLPTCTGGSNWSNGWIVWVDKNRDLTTDANEIISVFEPLSGNSTFATATPLLGYDSRGFGLAAASTFTLCDDRTAEMGRVIKVNAMGRTNVSRQVCP